MYTYENSFHNTETHSRFSPEDLEKIKYRLASGTATEAEKALRRRMHNKLCGSNTCTCGDEFGIRS